jgi:ParB family chromosome partitioning protein
LGRGLSALIPSASPTHASEQLETIPVDRIRPGKYQPRDAIDSEALEALAASIRAHGVIQPIVVRKVGPDYEIIAGERRWRAAQIAELAAIPAVVRHLSDAASLQVALVENLQREDLNPVERARAYRRLLEEFNLTQMQIAAVVGRSQPSIANALRLLTLETPILESIESGQITEAHARLLLAAEVGDRLRLWTLVKEREMSVREFQDLLGGTQRHAETKDTPQRRGRRPNRADPNRMALEESFRQRLGTQVRIRNGRKKGFVEIEYYSEDDLVRIAELLLGQAAWGE